MICWDRICTSSTWEGMLLHCNQGFPSRQTSLLSRSSVIVIQLLFSYLQALKADNKRVRTSIHLLLTQTWRRIFGVPTSIPITHCIVVRQDTKSARESTMSFQIHSLNHSGTSLVATHPRRRRRPTYYERPVGRFTARPPSPRPFPGAC